ncbi:MAG: isoaspartyl peptidase/L-asparaginase [Microscillaceae bacterium]|nr:isoaspartyl peptidase/L-asparaginase [Microscillaceae bacterium]
MQKLILFLALPVLLAVTPALAQTGKIALAIHGGAGMILKENMSPALEKQYRDKLSEALQAGYKVLKAGGTSLDAISAVIVILEESPLFNAGKGAVLTNEGRAELDAAIMDGKTGLAGAVAGLTTVKNPILLARQVMEHSPHVMMIGGGAEKFARERGLEMVDNAYFRTDTREQQLKKIQEKEKKAAPDSQDKGAAPLAPRPDDDKFGTVGAVALDQFGNLAAGTSTGGMTNKRYGRVGDVPIIGAGTYARNETCAVSCTGHGEFFIRQVVAYDVAALMAYKGLSLQAATEEVVNQKLKQIGGEGGLIAIDQQGNIAMPFNSAGMYRGYIRDDGSWKVMIYGNE